MGSCTLCGTEYGAEVVRVLKLIENNDEGALRPAFCKVKNIVNRGVFSYCGIRGDSLVIGSAADIVELFGVNFFYRDFLFLCFSKDTDNSSAAAAARNENPVDSA